MPRRYRPLETACLLLTVVLIAPSAVAMTETDLLIEELQAGPGNSLVEGEYKPTLSSAGSEGEFESGSNGIPPEVWEIIGEESGLPELEKVLGEGEFENGPNGIPPEVWEIIGKETGVPDLGAVLDGDVTVEDVWDIVDSQYDLPDYGSIFGNDDILSGGYEDVIIKNFSGNNVIPINRPSSGGSIPLPPSSGGGNTPGGSGGSIPYGGQLPIPSGGNTTPAPKQTSRFNPFPRMIAWAKKFLNHPVFQAFGGGKNPRRSFQGHALGSLTRNSVVKSRDQANLLDQEMARLLAEPRLGEEGAQWIEQETGASQDILQTGLEQSNFAVNIATSSQNLTSTQDVAKAVATIGGHNAQLGGSNLMLQAQNQAALLQLQQLMSANIKLEANISEGIDEINRRERLERSRAFSNSAGETLFLPGVF